MIGRQPRRAATRAARALALLAAAATIPLASAPTAAATTDDGFEPIGKARIVSQSRASSDVAISRHAAVLAYSVATEAGGWDIRRRVRGERGDTLVSWPLDGESQDEASLRPEISADGRYVLYDSSASNLVPDDDNGSHDVFLYDAVTGVNTLVTRHPVTGKAVGGDDARISMDGRFVAFHSRTGLVSDDTNGAYDAYRYEVATGEVELVSRSLTGGAGNDDSFPRAISGDGNLVAFTSFATDLVEGLQPEFFTQLYVADMTTGVVRRITETPDGEPGDSWSYEASFDRTGRHLAFASSSRNLVPEFTGGVVGVFRADLRDGGLELVSKDFSGGTPDDDSWLGEISGNGRFVTYYSEAEDLVPYDTFDGYDVYLYDTSYDVTYLVSHAYDGTPANAPSIRPAMGASARYVAFSSPATNIVRDDNQATDVFLYRITRVGKH